MAKMYASVVELWAGVIKLSAAKIFVVSLVLIWAQDWFIFMLIEVDSIFSELWA